MVINQQIEKGMRKLCGSVGYFWDQIYGPITMMGEIFAQQKFNFKGYTSNPLLLHL